MFRKCPFWDLYPKVTMEGLGGEKWKKRTDKIGELGLVL
jgi:hypothetical protein